MGTRALVIAACVGLGALLLAVFRTDGQPDGPVADEEAVSAPDVGDAVPDSPFAVDPGPVAASAEGPLGSDAPAPPAETPEAASAASGSDALATVDLQSLGRAAMSDEEFEALRARLVGDPALLAALIQELRGETDASRIRRLSLLLGELGHPDVTALAVELSYSSDPAMRAAGLDLLKRAGGSDLDDRDAVVSGLLSSETDADILVSALGAISRPGRVDETARASMSTQVALLADHEDPAVRRASIDIVSRWTRDGSDTPVLLGGLQDGDASVRRGAAYAFVGHEAVDEDVRRELLRVVQDVSEPRGTRSAALLALKRAGTPDEDARQELLRLEERLNRRPLRDRSG